MPDRAEDRKPQPVDLTPEDYTSLAAFRHALRRFTHFSADAARRAGLTTSQHQALLAIKAFRGAGPDDLSSVGQLATQLIIAPHSAAELVARLQSADLLEKVDDASDRRRVGLRLTTRAEAALAALSLVHLREVRGLAPKLISILRDFDDHPG